MPRTPEAPDFSNEVLAPRKSILVSISTGTPDARLIAEITQNISNIQVGETVDLSGDKWEDRFAAAGKKFHQFQHGTLLLHRHEENGVKSALVAAAMALEIDALDIATVSGGWNRKEQGFVYKYSEHLTIK